MSGGGDDEEEEECGREEEGLSHGIGEWEASSIVEGFQNNK